MALTWPIRWPKIRIILQEVSLTTLQYEKVPIIRELKQDIEIGWDGGANLSNVRALAHAGIDVINVGSAITNAPDHAAMYKAISEEAER